MSESAYRNSLVQAGEDGHNVGDLQQSLVLAPQPVRVKRLDRDVQRQEVHCRNFLENNHENFIL